MVVLAATSGKCPTDDQNGNNFEVNNCGSAGGLCACSGVCVWGGEGTLLGNM